MCITKLALFFEKLQVSIPASWTPSSKAGRQAPSQFSHFCCFLNFTQFSKDSTLAKFSQHPFLLPPPPALFLSVFPDYLLLNLVASHHPPPNRVAYVDKNGNFALLVAFWRTSSSSSSSVQCGGFGVFTACKSNNGEHPKAQEAQKEIRSKQ
jgi:hypothetical protein